MNHPDPDALAGLVLHPGAVDADVRAHAEECPTCSALVQRLARVRSTAASADELVDPPARVRDRVLAEISDAPRVVPLTPSPAPRGTTGRMPAWAAVLVASLALVAGLGLGRLTVGEPASPPESPPVATAVVAATGLTPLDGDADRGTARAVRAGGAVTLEVSARDLGDPSGFLEVWLINLDGSRMVALGVLGQGDSGDFRVPRGLLDEGYRIVDISAEPDDGDPTHSGVSLARGTLA